jgi:hypothetical protein
MTGRKANANADSLREWQQGRQEQGQEQSKKARTEQRQRIATAS